MCKALQLLTDFHMARKGDIKRQAVVIIHGIGEQRPMDTLRSFVEGLSLRVKNFVPGAEKPRYWSRPDGVSEIYETRRITMEQFQSNPKTNFYEFYWAHHMRNTSFGHLVPWVWKLLSTPYKQIPQRLKPVLATACAFIALAGAALLVVWLYWEGITSYLKLHWALTAGVLAAAAVLLRLLFWVVKNPFSNLLLNTAGDAARYFNPMPSNIGERTAIRQEGIAFLRRLHERGAKPHNRIIVVGQSLGAVVAYDMLRLLWHEMHESFTPGSEVDHTVFAEMDRVSRRDGAMPHINDFQQLQYRCWKQHRQNGNSWLITDFITIAGAIAHADFYLLNKVPFRMLVRQKEFPTCPPTLEGRDKTLLFGRLTKEVDVGGTKAKRTVRFLNHAAPFAVTRWTNIYFTSDYVGGTGQRIFGRGVKDLEVKRKGLWLLPGGHTNYWDAVKDNEALGCIASAIGLSQTR